MTSSNPIAAHSTGPDRGPDAPSTAPTPSPAGPDAGAVSPTTAPPPPGAHSICPILHWPLRRWLVAVPTGVLFALLVAIPTDLIDTPVFGREIPPTWWSWPALIVSSVLAGLLTATYVARSPDRKDEIDARPPRGGYLGGLLTYFAVGCPVCNKLVLVAVGSAGAVSWFQPIQPYLQVVAIGLLMWALRRRIQGEEACGAPGAVTGPTLTADGVQGAIPVPTIRPTTEAPHDN